MKIFRCAWPILALAALSPAQAAKLQPQDFAALPAVSGPRLSPRGDRIVYSLTTTDLARDKHLSHLWIADWDGGRQHALGFGKTSETHPAFSPDGEQLAFIANRGKSDDPAQLWLLDLRGGEARQLSHGKGEISDFDWSPDGKTLVVVVADPDPIGKVRKKPADATADAAQGEAENTAGDSATEPEATKSAETPDDDDKAEPPIVITRFQFKQDIQGYLTDRRQHLALLNLADGQLAPLTSGAHDDLLPAFSPDGKHIAFVSKRGDDHRNDPDRSEDWNLFTVEARPGGRELQLITAPEADLHPDWQTRPAWSPDGKRIAYLHGGDPKLIEYATHGLAVIDAAGGEPRMLAAALDRNLSTLHWIDHGRALAALVEQDRQTQLVRIDADSGAVLRLSAERGRVADFDALPSGRMVMLAGTSEQPDEVYALETRNGRIQSAARQVSNQTQAFMKPLQLGRVESISARAADGNEVHGFITYPPDYVAGHAVPAMLFLHGGPTEQYEENFCFNCQLFAADGYAVITVNPRGSSGRGSAYASAIYADWGNKDVSDVLAAVDAVVSRGIADPQRLVVGGWSYGGMLTNYVIASDTRFKAAVSGASISNILAGYGTDEYIRDYENELGTPWKNPEIWTRISYPFLHADRIRTPTLFMGGSEDYNVPMQNVQQMYQALRSLGVPTELVIYPGEFHGFDRPSHQVDRWERWLAWYRQHLPPAQ